MSLEPRMASREGRAEETALQRQRCGLQGETGDPGVVQKERELLQTPPSTPFFAFLPCLFFLSLSSPFPPHPSPFFSLYSFPFFSVFPFSLLPSLPPSSLFFGLRAGPL